MQLKLLKKIVNSIYLISFGVTQKDCYCFKGYLVAGFFMHLNNEKKSIYYLLCLAGVFLMVLLSIPIMWKSSATNTDKDWLPYVSESEYVKAHKIVDHTESHDNKEGH